MTKSTFAIAKGLTYASNKRMSGCTCLVGIQTTTSLSLGGKRKTSLPTMYSHRDCTTSCSNVFARTGNCRRCRRCRESKCGGMGGDPNPIRDMSSISVDRPLYRSTCRGVDTSVTVPEIRAVRRSAPNFVLEGKVPIGCRTWISRNRGVLAECGDRCAINMCSPSATGRKGISLVCPICKTSKEGNESVRPNLNVPQSTLVT